ncbi:MAG: TetR/AcrR family transcriptional regulator [Oscillospiraceae bacterium]|nr:TetR/AcrR family transcriptional regulator [Oscillospiraceae bacterium]
MDRRQKKTRDAILKAFTELLSEKEYNQISVQEIIDLADVGRTTFYAHFETKDFLLKELCEELFAHITESAHGHISDTHGAAAGSIFLHLLLHIRENNQNILDLLSSPNNEMFLRYFIITLEELVRLQYADNERMKNSELPEDYLVHHIASSFVETVYWWISRKMKEPPETIADYFLTVIELKG